MTRRVAGIDVGTNSLLLLIADADGPLLTPLLDRSDICRLGQGVDRERRLHPAAIERTLSVLEQYAALCAEHHVTAIRVAGTSALRDAANRADFQAAARERCGLAVDVISGEREAELTYADVAAAHGRPGEPLALLDIGGGSTELVRGTDGRIAERRSLDIGSNRLTERVPTSDPPTATELAMLRAEARLALAPLDPVSGRLVGSGGTITTLAAVALGLEPYDAAIVGRTELAAATVGALVGRLGGLTLAERTAVRGLEPQRAPVIVAGAVLLEQALEQVGRDSLAVASGGLRFALARLAAAEEPVG